ncbi:uncharacterized protein LOC120920856 [Rana temporaria]|uniref:uncharacterized protein LOC120920856 n=1 Tax=Rana temporaria TaxID=8407 RepID=UPI001AAC5245|nr:uncharacterized protein LOC120920856 [Rana temporaria]
MAYSSLGQNPTVISHNVRGLNTPEKRTTLLRELRKGHVSNTKIRGLNLLLQVRHLPLPQQSEAEEDRMPQPDPAFLCAAVERLVSANSSLSREENITPTDPVSPSSLPPLVSVFGRLWQLTPALLQTLHFPASPSSSKKPRKMPPKKGSGSGSGSGARKAPVKRKLAEVFPPGEVLTDIARKQWKLGPPIGQGGFGRLYLGNFLSFF